jgi:hypothetical protein
LASHAEIAIKYFSFCDLKMIDSLGLYLPAKFKIKINGKKSLLPFRSFIRIPFSLLPAFDHDPWKYQE